MHEVLISLQNTLASRIAIRYAKQLERSDRFNMQAIHIPDIKTDGPKPGVGWVGQTWENALIRESREGISDLIRKEYLFHFSDSGLKTVSGPEDQVILGELEERPYDFFIEGQLHAFDPTPFSARISSPVYQQAACPILMVKNMAAPEQGALVLSTREHPIPRVPSWLKRLLSGLDGPMDMLSCRFSPQSTKGTGTGRTDLGIKRDTTPKTDQDHALPWQEIQQVFSGRGRPVELAEWASRYAMVISPLPRPGSALARMLAAIPTAVLLCPTGNPSQEIPKKNVPGKEGRQI